MALTDAAAQRWIASLVSSLDDAKKLNREGKAEVRQKPQTVLRATKSSALTQGFKERLAAQLEAAGVVAHPVVDDWDQSTPWIRFTRTTAPGAFALTFKKEEDLSQFVWDYWRQIPAFANFKDCDREVRLKGGKLICDLLFTRRRGAGVLVVELKRGRPGNEAATELFGYVQALRDEDPARPVEAWLISGQSNPELVDDLEALSEKHGVPTRWYLYGASLGMRLIGANGSSSATLAD